MYLLFDIGGTKVRYAVSKDGEAFENPVIVPSPGDDYEKAKKLFLDIKKELSNVTIRSVVAGVAGPLSEDHSKLENSPHLKGWIGQPLKEELEKIFEAPAYIENDAALVGLGEAVHGAGRGHEIVAYLSISTGVGGSRLVRGTIDLNALGFEPGHQIIDPDGTFSCPGLGCNAPGHLEGYVSGRALEKRFGKKPALLEDPAVWDEAARWLAVGLNNTIVHWSPHVVVLGGSMMTGKPAIPLESIRRYTKETVKIFSRLPLIEKGTLGDLGGLYGAMEFAKQHA